MLIESSSKLCLGTWKLFKKQSFDEGLDIMRYAISKGIDSFDTALVYSNGLSEVALSRIDNSVWVADKISSKYRCIDDLNVKDAYPSNYIIDSLHKISKNLDNKKISLLQIHNWSPFWGAKDFQYIKNIVKSLQEFSHMDMGVSLTDKIYPLSSINHFEYIQMPSNVFRSESYRSLVNDSTKKILIREIFERGKLDYRKSDLTYRESCDIFNNIYNDKNVFKVIVGCNSIESIDLLYSYRGLK
jgi:aryl-alcohol dehydrogenase-like predicted oxidoreductase